MPGYELFAFDLDGTLLDASGRIPADTLAFIRELTRSGSVTVATGRSLPSARPFLQELEISVPAVLYHGAVVWDHKQERSLRTVSISPEHAYRLLVHTADLPVDIQVYRSVDDAAVYVRSRTPRLRAFARREQLTVRDGGDWAEILASGVLKALCMTDLEELPGVEASLRHAVPELSVVRSAREYVEVLPPETTKGEALAWVCEELRIPLERVVAVGDQLSDLSMIQLAGLGVAMEGSPEELSASAQRVVRSIPALRDLLDLGVRE